MKQIKCYVLKCFLFLSVFFSFNKNLEAQSYFAGTGAGTGNTSTSATGVGAAALGSANSGTNISAFGFKALNKNTYGSNNTATGAYSLFSNTTGGYNTAVGNQTLYTNTNGYNNTAIGNSALYANIGGSNNTATGYFALVSNSTGDYNTAVGSQALYLNKGGTYNTGLGAYALFVNTSGTDNTSVGYSSLYSNTNGSYNTATGNLALYANKTGSFNTAIGNMSLNSNTIGDANTAIGISALHYNLNGGYNTAIGFATLMLNTSGLNNVTDGAFTLYSNSTGSNNTATGYGALFANKAGSKNIAVGDNAGSLFTFENGCIFIGEQADAAHDSLSNATAIGYMAKVDSSNKMVFGNTAVTSIGGQVGWTTFSDQRLKTNINKSKLGLDFILDLNPVTYNYKAAGQKNILYTGLIAQEVDAAAKKTGIVFSGVDKNGEYWGIRYAELTVPLIKSVQELNEKTSEREIALEQRIEKLESIITTLQNTTVNKQTVGQQNETETILFQNQPNPFNQSTLIRYQLKTGDKNASIDIRNLNGSLLKQILLNQSGKGQVSINASELKAGTYTYTLMVNSVSIETKLMILIK